MKMEEISKDVDIDSGFMIGSNKVPKLYCATGKTKCNDLYNQEECQCTNCECLEGKLS